MRIVVMDRLRPLTIQGIATALLSLALVTPAAAGPLDGHWYWKCDGPDDERGLTVIANGKIVVDQMECAILQIEKVGGEGQVWKTRNTCIEGDEAWVEDVIFGFERDIDGNVIQLVEIGMNDGYVLSYRQCN